MSFDPSCPESSEPNAPTSAFPEMVVEYSRPEEERRGTHLVLMFHGFNSHEQDLLALLPYLPQDGFTYASMRGPLIAPGPQAFRWFELDQNLSYDRDEAREVIEAVCDWITRNTADYQDVILLGFSQGMAMATSIARRQPDCAKAVVGLSGFVLDGLEEFFHDQELAARSPRLPLFYGRDQADPVIPEVYVQATLDFAREYTDVTKVLYAQMGHGVCDQEIKHVGEFLQHITR